MKKLLSVLIASSIVLSNNANLLTRGHNDFSTEEEARLEQAGIELESVIPLKDQHLSVDDIIYLKENDIDFNEVAILLDIFNEKSIVMNALEFGFSVDEMFFFGDNDIDINEATLLISMFEGNKRDVMKAFELGLSTDDMTYLSENNIDINRVVALLTNSEKRYDVITLLKRGCTLDMLTILLNNYSLTQEQILNFLSSNVSLDVVREVMDTLRIDFDCSVGIASQAHLDYGDLSSWMRGKERLNLDQVMDRLNLIQKIQGKHSITLKSKFFNLDSDGFSWRMSQREMSNAEMIAAIKEIAPDSGFENFVFGTYNILTRTRRYDCISGQERSLLKNILRLKDDIIRDDSCRVLVRDLFSNTSLSGQDGSFACHNRLSDIIALAAFQIDQHFGGGQQTEHKLSIYRNQLLEQLFVANNQANNEARRGLDEAFSNQHYGPEYKQAYRTFLKSILSVVLPSSRTQEDIYVNRNLALDIIAEEFSLDDLENLYFDLLPTSDIELQTEYEFLCNNINLSFSDYCRLRDLEESSIRDLLKGIVEKTGIENSDLNEWLNGQKNLKIEEITNFIVDLGTDFLDGDDYNDTFVEMKRITEEKFKKYMAKLFIHKLFVEGYIER